MLFPKRLQSNTSDHDDVCTSSRGRTASELPRRTWSEDRPVSLTKTLTRRMSRSKIRLAPATPSEDSSKYSIEIPHLAPKPWELDRHKRHSMIPLGRSTPPKEFPARFFHDMPREIYDCILIQIVQSHLQRNRACPSCYIKDMLSLSLVSRAWDRAVTPQLYRAIILPTNDSHDSMSGSEITGLIRLKRLRRTLRNHPALARYVLELHLAEIYVLYQQADIEKEEIVNLVASLVMAAPNLERVVGFQVPLTHSFDRLSHALSTRRNLKEQVWLLGEGNDVYSEEEEATLGPYYHKAHDQTERFLLLNSGHDFLSTLVLQQEEGQTSRHLNFRAIIGTLRLLPNLRHLALSGLAASAFTNLTLNSLPTGLQSLRLENLAGVNDTGLQRFLKSPQASSITKLTLINLALKSLLTILAVFSANLSELRSFTIAQDKAPTLTTHTTVPGFHSPRLQYLHWEFRSEAGPPPTLPTSPPSNVTEQLSFPFKSSEPLSCLATSLLATSIHEGAFPSLRNIRIPHDPQGLIQNLCKPLAAALTPHEVASLTTTSRISSSDGFSIEIQSLPSTPTIDRFLVTAHHPSFCDRADSVAGSSCTLTAMNPGALSPLRSRVAAHCRILAARKEGAMSVHVVDPDGEVCVNNVIGGYVGAVASQISYELEPDRSRVLRTSEHESSDRGEWLTEVHDLVGDVQTPGQRRGSCVHAIGSYVGRDAVRVEDLF